MQGRTATAARSQNKTPYSVWRKRIPTDVFHGHDVVQFGRLNSNTSDEPAASIFRVDLTMTVPNSYTVYKNTRRNIPGMVIFI